MRVHEANKLFQRERDASRVLFERRERSTRSRFTVALIKYAKLYCKYTKLAGFKYFAKPETTWFDRTLWFLLYAITVPAMVYTVYNGYLEFMNAPLLTSVDTEYFPTHKLHFPGVSICSINRISRRSAMEMANEIYNSNVSRLSIDEILDMILQLGDLYDSEFMMQNRLYRIDQLLAQFYGGYYDVTDVMKRLTPQCSAILSRCRFHGEEKNCSSMFALRKTQDGFCCTFNYATKGDDTPVNTEVDHRTEPIQVQNLTEDGGLAVLLEPFLDDNFYSILPIGGWKVTIFSPFDYPDTTSGGVIDILVSPRTQRSVEIDAIIFYSISSIIPYPLDKRDCVFTEEMVSLRAFYTYSDCIVDCKIEDMWRICRCIPFYLPNRNSRRVCNLEDMPCLARHKSRWYFVVPHEDEFPYEDEDENENETEIVHCFTCYPECNDVSYNAKLAESALKSQQQNAKLLNGIEIRDQAVLTVYFNSFDTIKLRQDVLYRWYELMGDVSGIWGTFVGFSVIAIVEFTYFLGLFVLELLKGTKKKQPERWQRPIRTIYWSELQSNVKQRTNNRYSYKY